MARIDAPATLRRMLIATLSAVVVFASLGVILASRAPVARATLTGARTAATSTKISIRPGACSGGGTSFCFKPESVNIAMGGTVVWTNASGVGHTASSCTASACPGAPANTGSNTFSFAIGAANGSTGSFTFTSAGVYTYYCMIHGYAAMHGKITVFAAPKITSFAPTSGAPGATVAINGQNLARASRVTFNGTAATISTDTATKIVVKVPVGATTGKIAVTTPGGTVTSAATFSVT
jgi:plastocyanin